MNRPEPDDLLKDVFADETLETLRQNSLGASLAALRARRRHRALRSAALASVPVLALATVLLWRETKEPATPQANISTFAVAHLSLKIYPAPLAASAPPVPTISDEQLLSLFPNRAVALLGEPGREKLVFFDNPAVSR